MNIYIIGILTLSLFPSSTTSAPLQNITIALPPGSSDHGTPGLLCTPAQISDILLFYLLNYVAHAATVLVRPGERADDYLVSVIGSLLFPSLGLYRGIEALLCGAILVRNDDLRKAARSGALCCVVRGADWRPKVGEEVQGAVFRRGCEKMERGVTDLGSSDTSSGAGKNGAVYVENSEKRKRDVHITTFSAPSLHDKFGLPIYVHRRIVHGTYILPEGYRFAILPHDAVFSTTNTATTSINASPSHARSLTSLSLPPRPRQPHLEISATYNVPKSLLALAQSVFAIFTLYRARGDQISQFGYAAFGLTVAPYAVMSIVNLLGNMCRPEYPALFMVEGEGMDEARARGGIFEGCVGRVVGGGVDVRADGELKDVDMKFEGNNDIEVKFNAKGDEKGGRPYRSTPASAVTEGVDGIELEPYTSRLSGRTNVKRTLAPLPKDLDYRITKSDDVVLVPSHPPIARLSQPRTETAAQQHILSIKLRKSYPPFKHATWIPSFSTQNASSPKRARAVKHALTAIISLLPLALIGGLSRFQLGSIPAYESSTWRAFTIQWACIGATTGLWFVLDQERKEAMSSARMMMGPVARVLVYVSSAAPAVGGFIVVGQMVGRFGTCWWVGR